MSNKKLNNKKALSILRNYFSKKSLKMKGGASRNICQKETDDTPCSIRGKMLKPNWCEMSTDLNCVQSPEGSLNITPEIETVSQKINRNFPQKLSDLKNILEQTNDTELRALCQLLDIELNSSDTKSLIINKLLKNKIMSVLDGNGWSYI